MKTLLASTEALFKKNLIPAAQLAAVRSYCDKRLFSLHGEILFLLFTGVTLFCTGAGLLIYQYIESWGHYLTLAILLAVTLACFYYPSSRHPGFSGQRTDAAKHIDDHLVLAATILSGLLIAYLQNLYGIFGAFNDVATLLACSLYFYCAYYFDHRGVLSLAITTLCATAGFSLTPGGLLDQLYGGQVPGYIAIGLGVLLLLWDNYAVSIDLKKHFHGTFSHFALHIICLASLINLFLPFWVFALVTGASAMVYFSRQADRERSLQMKVFVLLYACAMASVLAGRLVDWLSIGTLAVYLAPFYIAALIVLFIRQLKNIRHKHNENSVRA